jgi:hypothetical protein
MGGLFLKNSIFFLKELFIWLLIFESNNKNTDIAIV